MHELDKTGRVLFCVASGNHGIDIGLPAPANKQHGDDIGSGMYVYPAAFTGISNMIVVANVALITRGEFDTDYTISEGSN